MRTADDAKTTIHRLVDADWLEEHLDEPGIRIIEIDVAPTSYAAGHIPGAVLWSIYSDLKDDAFRPVFESSLEDLVRRSGIGPDDIVVFYGYAPALGFWLMTRLGYAHPRILNTSRSSWRDRKRPWTATAPSPDPTPCRLDDHGHTVRATMADVLSAIDDPSISILDVRSDLKYVGERFWPSGGAPEGGRLGRIPSSIRSQISSTPMSSAYCAAATRPTTPTYDFSHVSILRALVARVYLSGSTTGAVSISSNTGLRHSMNSSRMYEKPTPLRPRGMHRDHTAERGRASSRAGRTGFDVLVQAWVFSLLARNLACPPLCHACWAGGDVWGVALALRATSWIEVQPRVALGIHTGHPPMSRLDAAVESENASSPKGPRWLSP